MLVIVATALAQSAREYAQLEGDTYDRGPSVYARSPFGWDSSWSYGPSSVADPRARRARGARAPRSDSSERRPYIQKQWDARRERNFVRQRADRRRAGFQDENGHSLDIDGRRSYIQKQWDARRRRNFVQQRADRRRANYQDENGHSLDANGRRSHIQGLWDDRKKAREAGNGVFTAGMCPLSPEREAKHDIYDITHITMCHSDRDCLDYCDKSLCNGPSRVKSEHPMVYQWKCTHQMSGAYTTGDGCFCSSVYK